MLYAAWLWSISPSIVEVFGRSLRWYGLLFALAFLIGSYILGYMYRKDGHKEKEVDTLFIYAFIGITVGARLGHVLFYDPAYYLANPIEILYVHQGGLASHGAMMGTLLSLWIYARKKKISYLWLIDRVVIAIVLGGAFVRVGNFMNSEIYGKPSEMGVVFLQEAKDSFQQVLRAEKARFSPLLSPTTKDSIPNQVPIEATLQYERSKIADTTHLYVALTRSLPRLLSQMKHVRQSAYTLKNVKIHEQEKYLIATFPIQGIVRHPTQLYEAALCIIIFIVLWLLWRKRQLYNGQIFAYFMILLWSGRFFIEFIKEEQADFIGENALHMGQWLSLPAVAIGIGLWWYANKHPYKDQNA